MHLWGRVLPGQHGGTEDVPATTMQQDEQRIAQLQDLGEGRMSDRWSSPQWVLKMFESYHDPCPIDYTIDAFSYDWCEHHDQVYVNPPYSNPKPWVEKAIKEISIYPGSTIVMLLKHDSSTRWFKMLHEAGARFLMFQGRLDFSNPDGEGIKGSCASFPSVLVVLNEKVKVNHEKVKVNGKYQSRIGDYHEQG